LTLYNFSEAGKPTEFHDDHGPWLTGQRYFFARKIASDALKLESMLRSVAAKPDSGEQLNSFGCPTPFYDATMWARAEAEVPGQMYRADQRRRRYPGALSKNKTPFVMLFGPRPATQIAAKVLSEYQGFCTFGRIFHPDRVGIADHGAEVPGLTESDVAIRDFCPSLYLARVLNRAAGLAVIEHTPLDHPEAAYLAYDDPNCLFVACVPHVAAFGPISTLDTERLKLFTILALLEDAGHTQDNPDGTAWVLGHVREQARWAGSFHDRTPEDKALWDYWLHEAANTGVFRWIRDKALSPNPSILVLPWGGGAPAHSAAMERLSRIPESWAHKGLVDVAAWQAVSAALSASSVTDLDVNSSLRAQIARFASRVTVPSVQPTARAVTTLVR
jgi:hypothetical protein